MFDMYSKYSMTFALHFCYIFRDLLTFHSLIVRFCYIFRELSIYSDVSWFLPLVFVFIQHLNHYLVDLSQFCHICLRYLWYFHNLFRFVWDFVVFRVLGGISTLLLLLLLRRWRRWRQQLLLLWGKRVWLLILLLLLREEEEEEGGGKEDKEAEEVEEGGRGWGGLFGCNYD